MKLASFLKNLSPQGLLGRSFLIMAMPIILAQGVTSYIFFNHHWDTLERRLAITLVNEIVMITEAEIKKRPHIDEMAEQLGIFIKRTTINQPVNHPSKIMRWLQTVLDQEGVLRRELQSRLPYPVQVINDSQQIILIISLPHKQLTLTTSQKKVFSNTVFVYVIWSVALCILLVFVAWGFMRNQMRPIRDLAMTAEAFGQDGNPRRLKPKGAIEVRKATRAFNAMQDNLLQNLSQRTEMLAGISHDLRTPLTRMRLALAMLPDDVKNDLLPDVEEMQAMIDSYLAFTRDDYSEEWQSVNLNNLLQKIALQLRDDGLKIVCLDVIVARAKPLLLKRCLINLIINALNYGTVCHVMVSIANKYIEIAIQDNGVGMDQQDFERAKTPFVRLQDARTVEGGHVGLGLSIAEDIAKRHGYPLVLDNNFKNGTRIIVRLNKA